MRVVVTEVTNMRPGTYCVAAYEEQTARMVRPKPEGGNWSEADINRLGVVVGRVLDLGNRTRQQNESHLPHRNEDLYVYSQDISANEILRPNPNHTNSVQQSFNNCVQLGRGFRGFYKAYVEDGANCASLVGVNIPSRDLSLYISEYDGRRKLRARFTDGQLDGWDLGVTCTELNRRIHCDEVLMRQYAMELAVVGNIHLRVGLARRFAAQQNRCFVQLNGIIY